MYGRLVLFIISSLVAGVISVGASPVASSAIPPHGASAAFRFSTTVTTPKGRHAGSGTITIKHTQGRSLTLTVQSDDGKTKTIPLVVNSDGSDEPDPSAPPMALDQQDAAARVFMADLTLAAHVGMAARKNAPAAGFDVPVKLTPIGDGAPVSTQLHMTGTMGGAQYAGSVQGNTTTTLPQKGGLDPSSLAKSAGVGALDHAFTPAGKAAVAVVMHRREQQQQQNPSPLSDAMALTVTTHLTNGRFHEIDGTQDDSVTIHHVAVKIVSTWSFTKTSSP